MSVQTESVSTCTELRQLGASLVTLVQAFQSGKSVAAVALEELTQVYQQVQDVQALPADWAADKASVERAGGLFLADLLNLFIK